MLEYPAVSLRGQVAHEWVYYVSYGRQLRRSYVVPFDPKTISQHTQRAKFFVARQWWNELTPAEKQSYADEAKARRLSLTGYNLFLRAKIKEVPVMVKQVIHGSAAVPQGVSVVVVPEITIGKTFLFYNTYGVGATATIKGFTGIVSAHFISTTEIEVDCVDEKASGAVMFYYQLIEYV